MHRRVRARRLLATVVALLLSGCAGGGLGGLPASPPGPAAVSTFRATMTFTVTAPLTAAVLAQRSFVLAVDGGAQSAARDLAGSSDGCVAQALPAPLRCELGFALAPGAHTFAFTTYAGALDASGKPSGAQLAHAAGVPFSVSRAAANEQKIALDGVPTAVALLAPLDQDVQGTQQGGFDLYGFFAADGTTRYDRTFSAIATDAAGALLLGAAAPAVGLRSSDPGVLSNGTAAAGDPTRFTIAALRYDAAVQPWFTLVATSAAGAQVTTMAQLRIAARNAPRIYVVDHLSDTVGKIWVFDERGDQVRVSGTFEGLRGALGIGFDPKLERLYVTNEFASTISVFDPDGRGVAVGGAFANLYFPLGLSVDAVHGRIYAGNFNGGTARNGGSPAGTAVTVYDEAGNQLPVAGAWREREGDAPYLPYGVFADPATGRVYLADAGYNRAEAYDANGAAVGSWSTGEGAAGIAQDAATKDLYVTDDALGVNVYDPAGNAVSACAGGRCSGGPAGGAAWHHGGFDDAAHSAVHGPTGIRQSPGNGWFYVTNYVTNSVAAFDRDGNPMTLRGGNLNGGPFGYDGNTGAMQGPIAIEVVP